MPRRLLIALLAMLAAALPTRQAMATSPAYHWRFFYNPHPAPLFYQSSGIAAGSSGNIFIADGGDHRVVKLSPSGSPLAVWGADVPGPLRLERPRAIAVDASGNVYLADDGVVKLSYAGRFLSRWTGGVLSYPRGLAVDRARNLYVLSLHPIPFEATFDRITISKLSSTGRLLGRFVYSYPYPPGDAAESAAITTTPNGNLLLSLRGLRHCHSCDGTYYLLRTISPTGKTLAEVPESAGGDSTAVDGAGNVYLTKSNQIVKLSPTGATISTFGTPGCGLSQLGAELQVAASPLGSLYVADSQIPATRPDTIAAAFRAGVLHRFALDGTPENLYGACPTPGATTAFGQINDLATTASGNVFVADGITSKIYHFGPNGTMIGSFDAVHPSTVTTDSHGYVYVPNMQVDALEKRTPDGKLLARTAGYIIEAAAVAPAGDVFALTAFGEVLHLPPLGQGTTPMKRWWLQGFGPGQGGLDPQGITLDGQGNVWVADIRHNNIQKFSPSGRLLLIWGRGGSGPNRFQNPAGLTVDGRGHLFVLDSGNNRVQEFDLNGHYLATYGREGQAPGQFMGAFGIGHDAAGNIYVGDRLNDRIQELVLSS